MNKYMRNQIAHSIRKDCFKKLVVIYDVVVMCAIEKC